MKSSEQTSECCCATSNSRFHRFESSLQTFVRSICSLKSSKQTSECYRATSDSRFHRFESSLQTFVRSICSLKSSQRTSEQSFQTCKSCLRMFARSFHSSAGGVCLSETSWRTSAGCFCSFIWRSCSRQCCSRRGMAAAFCCQHSPYLFFSFSTKDIQAGCLNRRMLSFF